MQNAEQRIGTMFEKLQKGDQELNHTIQQAILLLGNTGAGKTTSSYILTNKQLISQQLHGQIVYKYKQKYLDAEIGHTRNSCTQIPNTFQQEFGSLIDCPGFLDSFKFDRYITNAYYIYRIFSNSKKLKFIITCNQAALTASRARDFVQSFKCFLDLFKFDQKFTGKDLAQSTVLLITKANQLEKSSVTEMLEMLKLDPPEDLEPIKSKAYVELLQILIEKNNYYIIDCAVAGQGFPKNNILKQIHSNTVFWEREQVNNNFSMKNINFQINLKNMKKDQNALASKACLGCNQTLANLAKCLASALQQIEKNINDQEHQFNFFNLWKQQMQQTYSFNGKQTDFKQIQRHTDKYLRNIILLDKIHFRISNVIGFDDYDEQKDPFFRVILTKQLILNLIEYILQYLKMTGQQQKILKQFAYLIIRKFQQIKVLGKLNPKYGKINREAIDFIVGFTADNYNKLQQKYALLYQIKQNQQERYYLQVGSFLQKYKSNEKIIKKLEKIEFLKGKLAEKSNKKRKALIFYIEAIKNSQLVNAQVNKNFYTVINKQLYEQLANIFLEIKNYKFALVFYKVINQIQKIKLCYDQLFKTTQMKSINRIEKGDYLREMTLFEEAIHCYIEAINASSVDSNYMQYAAQRIIELHQKKETFTNDYKKKLMNSQFYRRLPKQFNFDEVISELEDETEQGVQ